MAIHAQPELMWPDLKASVPRNDVAIVAAEMIVAARAW
jgi:hypothetical protein